jgi:arylsulfatase A-like enzyme
MRLTARSAMFLAFTAITQRFATAINPGMKSAFLFGFFVAASPLFASSGPAPNIVVIVSDDAGFNEFSIHGSTLFKTPRIDSIARDGVHFTNGYTSGAVCSPTRAGLLTGRYQNRFGHEFNIPPVYSETNGLSLEETTLPEVLAAHNYQTIALGKWHLGYAPQFHPLSRGFSDYYGFLQGARSYFPLEKPTILNRLLHNREPIPETFDYMTDELGRTAAKYIADRGEKPFFMYLAFNATHGPNHATEADLKTVKGGGGNETHRAMTAALDRAVGMVLDELEQQKIADNTLVFFLNDNGGVFSHDNTPLRGFKGSTWEGGIRVPFAMRWPKAFSGGKVVDAPVISLDIFPTALAAAGVTTTPGKPLDGVNLLPFADGSQTDHPHETLYWKNGSKWAVRHGDLKLVAGNTTSKKSKKKKPKARTPKDVVDASIATSSEHQPAPQLFNVAADPSETENLAVKHPEIVAELRGMYEQWKKDFPPRSW